MARIGQPRVKVSREEKNAVEDRAFFEANAKDEEREEQGVKNRLERSGFLTRGEEDDEHTKKMCVRGAKKSAPRPPVFQPFEARQADAIPHQKETRSSMRQTHRVLESVMHENHNKCMTRMMVWIDCFL